MPFILKPGKKYERHASIGIDDDVVFNISPLTSPPPDKMKITFYFVKPQDCFVSIQYKDFYDRNIN